MILHLIKDPGDPLAAHVLSSMSSSLHVAVLLRHPKALPRSVKAPVYQLTENAPDENKGEIIYDRLLDLIFEAEKVIAI